MNTNTTLDPDTPRFRSGVAARMARMPTSTLRIWERRYAVINPTRSNAGQRLYSRRDVQRLVLLKGLCDRGHAIGAIAGLDIVQLEELAHDDALGTNAPRLPESVIALGPGWVKPASPARANPLWHHYPSVVTAKMASLPRPVDALLVRIPSLHPDAVRDVLKLADRCAARNVIVAYSFGSQAALNSLREAGARLHREMGQPTETTAVLGQALYAAGPKTDNAAAPWIRARRRFSDAQLAAAAQASSVVACECPRHLADLIGQLSAFEQYSDNCAARNANDAVLHRYFGDVANSARQLFETALERLAETEGLPLHAIGGDRERSARERATDAA